MKNKTDAQKAFDSIVRHLEKQSWGGIDNNSVLAEELGVIQNMLTNPEKLNTSEKHVNETPNNEHVEALIDDVEQIVSDTHDVDVLDRRYAINIIDHLHKNGHLNTTPDDMVLVPREPVKCAGLCRDIMMARDLGYRTGQECLEHLLDVGHENIPENILVELKGKGHLSKGDMCAIIFKAMIQASEVK